MLLSRFGGLPLLNARCKPLTVTWLSAKSSSSSSSSSPSSSPGLRASSCPAHCWHSTLVEKLLSKIVLQVPPKADAEMRGNTWQQRLLTCKGVWTELYPLFTSVHHRNGGTQGRRARCSLDGLNHGSAQPKLLPTPFACGKLVGKTKP